MIVVCLSVFMFLYEFMNGDDESIERCPAHLGNDCQLIYVILCSVCVEVCECCFCGEVFINEQYGVLGESYMVLRVFGN